MSKKWKIFGIQTNVEWYDVKTKCKQLLRKITYSWLFQEVLCFFFASYIRLVYFTSQKTLINQHIPFGVAKNKTPLIFCFWHNRLMMMPLTTRKQKKAFADYELMTLASKHGDGRLVGTTMRQLGMTPVYGSSKNGRKSSRGIDVGTMKTIFKGLKKGVSLGITPDGPRGPNQKINGDVVNIARIAGVGMVALSYSSSRFKKLNSWDKFTLPLPFSKLCFYFDDEIIYVDKNANEEEMEKIKQDLEQRLNLVQQKSEDVVNKK